MKYISKTVPALLLSGLFTACGGGGTSNDNDAAPATTAAANTPPSSATSAAATPVQVDTPSPTGQNASQYTLTFAEEFNSGTSVDTSKWSTDIWYKPDNPARNYDVVGGNLRIWPTLDATGKFFDRTFVTDGKFAQQYGFFEVEAKLPVGAGLHPVISLIATNGPEIGIMHSYSGAPNGGWSSNSLTPIDYVVTAVNSQIGYDDEFRANQYIKAPDLSAGFHKYGVRWDANAITYYFDGAQIGRTITNTAVRAPMYFYIGLWMVDVETVPAIGSGVLGITNPYTPTGPDNAMQVNYVRAWQFK
jgi:beta-glucanase (GH16 family)